MKTPRARIGLAALAVITFLLSACSGSSTGADAKTATLLMNWFAQAEQGGYWAAQA